MKYLIIYILLSIFFNTSLLAQNYRTEALSPNIATIQVNAMGEWNRNNIIKLNSDEYIRISFDYLGEETLRRLRYKIIHCDANWRVSREIAEIEYLNGFNNNLIDDYAISVNTTVDYTNYILEIPNSNVTPRLSGNYVVQVFDENEPEKILLNACFSVIEPIANIGYTVSSVTNIDANKGHQQISLVLHHKLNIIDPISDLKMIVMQNNRLDTERKNLKPMMITPNKITYEQNNDLIFEAGNEYRRFETSSYRSNGMRISNINYKAPYYFCNVESDKIRANKTYNYDQDQDGRFFIRSIDSDISEYEADYFITTFTIPMENPISQDIYLNGNFTYDTFNDKYKMKYDVINKQYRLSLLLKQGLYNYQYLTRTINGYSTAQIEGNYYETENEYTALAYYKPMGQRYDKLIAAITFYSRKK